MDHVAIDKSMYYIQEAIHVYLIEDRLMIILEVLIDININIHLV